MSHPQQELLELCNNGNTEAQIVDMIMSDSIYEYGRTPDGRFVRKYILDGSILYIMRTWDILLIKEGLTYDQFGHGSGKFHGHHPDGNVQNDRDVISIDASTHMSIHMKGNKHAEGNVRHNYECSPETRHILSQARKKEWKLRSKESRIAQGNAISLSKGGHPNEVDEFFTKIDREFTVGDFAKSTGYRSQHAWRILKCYVEDGLIYMKKENRANLYGVILSS